MINKNIKNSIVEKLNKGDKKSPFLFIGKNSEILNSEVKALWIELLKDYEIPYTYLYTLEDNWEKIKIKDIKEFIYHSNSKPPYKFQIFFIENISRFTISAWNSLLKFFEEPDSTNLIFLTSTSESWILDTILSRVHTFNIWGQETNKKSEFYISMINNYINKRDPEIISYFFRNKLEKEEYINFLENIIIYAKENFKLIEFLTEIDEDINAIKQNNVNAKYVVDKWLLKI